MRTLTLAFLLFAGFPALAQDAAPIEEPPKTEAIEEPADDGALLRAVDLREKVRNMRRSVLGGGPAVEEAEREALVFYRRKIQETASRIDELRTDRDAKDAEYRLALDFGQE